MSSVFDPKYQETSIESKIVAALERVSEAFRVMLWNENKKHNLSPLQIQILIFLYFHDSSKSTVTYLANEFNMTKATISDAIRVLVKKGYIKREKSQEDSRCAFLSLTEHGHQVADEVSHFANTMKKNVEELHQENKELFLCSLLDLISNLQQQGILSISRMCYSCAYFQNGTLGKHCGYCNRREAPISQGEFKVDCASHQQFPKENDRKD